MRLDTGQALRPVVCLPNPSAMQGARWGEARLDTRQALRPVVCLSNPSAMQGARWGEARLDTGQALRPVVRLPYPNEPRPQEVPVGQGARWSSIDAQRIVDRHLARLSEHKMPKRRAPGANELIYAARVCVPTWLQYAPDQALLPHQLRR